MDITVLLWLGLLTAAIGMGCYDRFYSTDPIRRNFPIVGRISSWMPWLGHALRSNLLDSPAEKKDKPFSQRDIDYVKEAAKGLSPLISFGTEELQQQKPTFRFLTARYAYPAVATDSYPPEPLVIGERSRQPYLTRQRIMVSALSFGALSERAVESISAGASLFNTLYNVGEGGIPPSTRRGEADLILQLGTANYFIGEDAWTTTDAQLQEISSDPQIKMIEIKLSQGASIGKEGGFLPGQFMTGTYCEARRRPDGFDTIAPNRHPYIDSDESLATKISQLREKTGKPIGIKLGLSHEWQWDPFFDYLHQQSEKGDLSGIPDFISIDGAEGGTSAGKMAFLQHIGLPLQDALLNINQSLIKYDLRQHTILIASGKLATPERVAMAFCLGADMVGIARGVMFSLGCIQAMRCNKRTCPTGITTHHPYLIKGIDPTDKKIKVANYLQQLHKDVAAVAHACGVRCYDELSAEHILVTQERRGNYQAPIPLRQVS